MKAVLNSNLHKTSEWLVWVPQSTILDDSLRASIDANACTVRLPAGTTADDGQIFVRVLVSAKGCAKDATIFESSGHINLDCAAIAQALHSWKFRRTAQDLDTLEGWVTVPVAYRIVDERLALAG